MIRPSAGGARELAMLRFGLVPRWADDPKIAYKMINARGETVDRLPSFRDAYAKRRCLIPTDGFFEWQTVDGIRERPRSSPISSAGRTKKPFAFAGIHERWQSKDGSRTIESFAIVTTPPTAPSPPSTTACPSSSRRRPSGLWLDLDLDASPADCALSR